MLTAPVLPGSTRDVILVTVRGAVICTLRTSSASGRSFWNSNVCSTGAFSPTLPKLYEFEAVVWANAIVAIVTTPQIGSSLTSATRIIGAKDPSCHDLRKENWSREHMSSRPQEVISN